MYKILRIIPYVILLFLAYLFWYMSKHVVDPTMQAISINLASSALFVVAAYLFYDMTKAYVEKKESRYITEHINHHVSQDILVVLHLVKKYIHGYNLKTNTLDGLMKITRYSVEKIRSEITQQIYLGFEILKEIEDLKAFFKSAVSNSLIVKYAPRENIISLLKIISLLVEIEHMFKDPNNFNIFDGKVEDFIIVNGKDIDPKNDDKLLLVKKAETSEKFVVYDSGYVEPRHYPKLLQQYVLKPAAAALLANKIIELIQNLQPWLPRHAVVKCTNKYRINQDFFSMCTDVLMKQNKIYVADVINMNVGSNCSI